MVLTNPLLPVMVCAEACTPCLKHEAFADRLLRLSQPGNYCHATYDPNLLRFIPNTASMMDGNTDVPEEASAPWVLG